MPWFNYGGIFLGKMFDFQIANYNFFQFLPKMQIFPKTLRDTFLEALEVTFTVSHSVIQSFGHSVKLFALLQKYSFRQNSSSEVLFIC